MTRCREGKEKHEFQVFLSCGGCHRTETKKMVIPCLLENGGNRDRMTKIVGCKECRSGIPMWFFCESLRMNEDEDIFLDGNNTGYLMQIEVRNID